MCIPFTYSDWDVSFSTGMVVLLTFLLVLRHGHVCVSLHFGFFDMTPVMCSVCALYIPRDRTLRQNEHDYLDISIVKMEKWDRHGH